MDHLKKIFAVLFVMAVVFSATSCKRAEERGVPESGKAPDFSLADLRGSAVKLSQLRGKVVIVEFWATWCPPCRDSVSELNKVHERFKDKDFELLAISVNSGEDAGSQVSDFVREHAIVYPVMVDNAGVNVSYGVSSIPVMFVIDKDGRVAKRHMGFMPGLAETLSKDVEELL